jgi:hypothetical protein
MNTLKLRYLFVVLYSSLVPVAAISSSLETRDEATIALAFAATTGVLAGLYSVIPRQTEEVKNARPTVMAFLLVSLFLSLGSAIRMLNTPPDVFDSKLLFDASALGFTGSTIWFAIKAGLLSQTT